MKIFLLTVIGASLAAAQSHPSWWTYASPDATALVGIHWENLRQSPFAEPIRAELSSSGSLGFPDLDCLRQAREMVLSSPPLLAAEAGKFPPATVQQQAAAAGLKRAAYKGVTMFLPAQANAMGVAQMSDTLILVGERKTLERAVDRSLQEVGRRYTPLLMRAARYSQTGDLWVVSVQLPDPLASLFVPLEANAENFEGSVSVRDGLNAEASFDSPSDAAAAKFAAGLQKQAPTLPAVARGMRAAAEANRVTIDLQVSQDQLNAELRAPKPAPAPPPPAPVVEIAKAEPPPPPPPPPTPVAAPAPVAAAEIPAPAPAPAAPPVPQVVRIVGLDDGPREIPYRTAP